MLSINFSRTGKAFQTVHLMSHIAVRQVVLTVKTKEAAVGHYVVEIPEACSDLITTIYEYRHKNQYAQDDQSGIGFWGRISHSHTHFRSNGPLETIEVTTIFECL